MITEYALTGLSRNKSVTCVAPNEEFFWPKVIMSQDRFNAFWDYFSNRKDEKFVAVIDHAGSHFDGMPKNPVLIEIKIKKQ